MSKSPSTSTVNTALKLGLAGKSQKEVLEATGLNYSQYWWACTELEILHDPKAHGGWITGDSDTALAAAIVKARAEGQSWGLIAVRCELPEGRISRIFKEAAGIDRRGLRNGKGGRWLANDPRFYTGADRAKAGTELIPGKPLAEQVPEADAPAKRELPKVAERLFAPKGTEKRTRQPLTAEQRAKRAEARKAKAAAKEAPKA